MAAASGHQALRPLGRPTCDLPNPLAIRSISVPPPILQRPHATTQPLNFTKSPKPTFFVIKHGSFSVDERRTNCPSRRPRDAANPPFSPPQTLTSPFSGDIQGSFRCQVRAPSHIPMSISSVCPERQCSHHRHSHSHPKALSQENADERAQRSKENGPGRETHRRR